MLIDIDHWYAHVKGWPDGRWLHHTLASTPSLIVLLALFWGLVTTALTLGWNNLTPDSTEKALFLLETAREQELMGTLPSARPYLEDHSE